MLLVKNIDMNALEGLLFSLIAILIVFIVLVIIILCVNLLSKIHFKETKEKKEESTSSSVQKKLTIDDIKDEDMMVAALIATIEFVEETKEKDARLVSIKQIG